MKNLTAFFLAFFLSATMCLAQSTETRRVSGFDKISVSGAWDVYIKQGSEESVRLEGKQDLIDKMEVEVSGTNLKIHKKKGSGWNWNSGNGNLKIYITYRNLNALVNSGSNDVYFESTVKANDFSIVCSGSGDVEGNFEVDNDLDITISGSSGLSLSGSANHQKIVISGSGDVEAANLKSKTTEVTVSGSGNIEVYATEMLEGRVSGSGDIYYKGNPSIKVKVSGSGDIQQMN